MVTVGSLIIGLFDVKHVTFLFTSILFSKGTCGEVGWVVAGRVEILLSVTPSYR